MAEIDSKVIGASGYKLLGDKKGKTTLLGVLPKFNGKGIGKVLQEKRLEAMHDQGVETVVTNADRPSTIKWYKENYGYKKVGNLKKICSFGDDSIDQWTTLEMDLKGYYQNKKIRFKREYNQKNQPHPLSPY